MPTADKIRWSQLRVGLLAVVALILLGILIFLLTGSKSFFAKNATVFTYMNDVSSLSSGSAVRLNGITIGSIKKISFNRDGSDPKRIIEMQLSIQQKMLGAVPVDSVIGVSADNVLGTKLLNIKKGRSSQALQDGGTLRALEAQGLEDFVKSGSELLDQLQSTLNKADTIVGNIQSGKGSIGKLLVEEELYNRAVGTIAEVQKLAAALNSDKGTLGKLLYDDALYTDVRSSLKRVDSVVANIQSGNGTMGKLLYDESIYNEAQRTLADFHKIVKDLDEGKGTAGQLLKRDDVANQLKATMARFDSLLAKMNAGQGTLGQLLVNQQLYDSLNGTTTELQGLLKDFRANPKKFLRIKLALF